MTNLRACFRHLLLAAVLTSSGMLRHEAVGGTLYSGGDVSAGGYTYDEIEPAPYNDNFQVFSQFTVPQGSVWTVSSLFANIVTDGVAPSQIILGNYAIRENVSGGNGGTLLFSGNVPITGTDDNFGTANGEVYLYTGLLTVPLTLSAGTYWMDFAPYTPSLTNVFLDGSDGQDAVNEPANAANYFNYTADGGQDTGYFQSAQAGSNFSEGLSGLAVPEPSVWALLIFGGAGLLAGARSGPRAAGSHR